MPLAQHTTLALGGPAADWRPAKSLAEVREALRHAGSGPILVLGGGSNLVCADDGFDGTVLAIDNKGVYLRSEPPPAAELLSSESPNVSLDAAALPMDVPVGGAVWLHVAAGEVWDDVVRACCTWGLAGIECLSGIPGKAGATPIQNVGAYGQELSDCLWSITCVHRKTLELVQFSAEACQLGYRHSRFKAESRDEYVVIEVVLRLARGGAPNLNYAEIARQFQDQPAPDLLAVRQVVLATRKAKSLVFDRSDPNTRNCGSFFVNPVVPRSVLTAIQTRYEDPVPHFAVGASAVGQERAKIPAAWLIERAGFGRGHRAGNVGLSTKHTLCLVAHDGATATELVQFAREIRDAVQREFGVELVPEPVFVGVGW